MSNTLAPFVKIYNKYNQEFLQLTRTPDVEYVNSVKKDDSTRITIYTNQADLVDSPFLQPGRILYVQFGYIGGEQRTVQQWIFNVLPEFNQEGIRIVLECYAKAAYMALNTSKVVRDQANTLDMAQEMADEYNLIIDKQASLNIQNDPILPSEIPADEIDSYLKDATKDEAARLEAIWSEEKVKVNSTPAVKANINLIGFSSNNNNVQEKQVYKIKSYRSKPQANNSDKAELRDTASRESSGKINIRGEDNKLVISKRDFSQEPSEVFTFYGNEDRVLSFRPQERNLTDSKGSFGIKVNHWDATSKEYNELLVDSQFNSNDSLLGKTKKIDGKPIDEGLEFSGTGQDGSLVIDEDFVENASLEELENLELEASPGKRIDVVYIRTNGNNRAAYKEDKKIRFTFKSKVRDIHNSIEQNIKDSEQEAANIMSDKEADLYKSELVILGNPKLKGDTIIKITGVGDKYSGNWFVDSTRHVLKGGQAYKTTLELVRNSLGIIKGTSGGNYIDGANYKFGVNQDFKTKDSDETRIIAE